MYNKHTKDESVSKLSSSYMKKHLRYILHPYQRTHHQFVHPTAVDRDLLEMVKDEKRTLFLRKGAELQEVDGSHKLVHVKREKIKSKNNK